MKQLNALLHFSLAFVMATNAMAQGPMALPESPTQNLPPEVRVLRELELAQGLYLNQEQLAGSLSRSADFLNHPEVDRLRRPLSIRHQVLGCYEGQLKKENFGFSLMGVNAQAPSATPDSGAPVPLNEKRLIRQIGDELLRNSVASLSTLVYRFETPGLNLDQVAETTVSMICSESCSPAERAEMIQKSRQHLEEMSRAGLPRLSVQQASTEISDALVRSRKKENHLREYYQLLSRPEAMIFYTDAFREEFFAGYLDPERTAMIVSPKHIHAARNQVIRAARRMLKEVRSLGSGTENLKKALVRFPIALPKILLDQPGLTSSLCPLFKEIDRDERQSQAMADNVDSIFRWLSVGLLVAGGVILVSSVIGAYAGGMALLTAVALTKYVALPLGIAQVAWSMKDYYVKSSDLDLFLESQMTGNLDPRSGERYLKLLEEKDSVIFDFALNMGFLALGTSYAKSLIASLVKKAADRLISPHLLDMMRGRIRQIRKYGLASANEDRAIRHWARFAKPNASPEELEATYRQIKATSDQLQNGKRFNISHDGKTTDEVAGLIMDFVDNGTNAL